MQQRKGLTPIIAVVLLLMMTVAAAGLAYQFVIGTQSEVQDKVTAQVDTQLGSSDVKFSIDQVVQNGADMRIVLRNTGNVAIATQAVTMYINGVVATPLFPAAALNVGATANLDPTTTPANDWPGAGTPKVIRLVHASGVSITYTCTPASTTATVC